MLTAQGKYEIQRRIAAGGMAEVYLARATGGLVGLERLVAIKRILPQHAKNAAFVQMFLDEARIAATLQHPNVVQMLEVGHDGDTYFIVMEYLNGENVRAVFKQRRALGRPISLENALGIVINAASGLHYAHEKAAIDGRPLNIVHRDISPQNLFVTHEGAVKVVDFGIAKASNRANDTMAGTLKGKIPYMSPEQCAGEALDRRSDIYALGAVLFELTVGRRLVKKAPEYLMMKQIIEGEVTKPSEVLPLYPEGLEVILLKALARRRGQRYQTMQAFQADLEEFAREHRLNTSSIALAEMMREAYGATGPTVPQGLIDDEDDAWASPEPAIPEALAQNVDLARAHGVTPAAASPAHPLLKAAGKGAPTVEQREVGSVTVFTVTGRLTEAFQGAEIGRHMSGDVVLDLAGVERVTSFGVREWLAMMGAAQGRVNSLYLARCTEPIVNQLTMIRGFAGPGKVLSFFAPYACVSCQHAFHRLVDAEADVQAIRRNDPPPASCPQCGADGRFDDDPRSYFAIASQLASAVPPAIREATGPVERFGRPSLEKLVDGDITRIVVNGRMDAGLRWRGALEGLEGRVVLDLSQVTEVMPDAVPALVAAMRRLTADVERLDVEGAPTEVVHALVQARLANVRVEGQEVTGRSASKIERPLAPSAPIEPEPERQPPPELVAPPTAPTALPDAKGPMLALILGGGAVLAVLAVVFALAAFQLMATEAVEGTAPAAPAAERAPPWSSVPFAVDADVVTLVGHANGAVDDAAAVAAAREEALEQLLIGAATQAGRPVPAMPDDPSARAAAVARYLAAFGTTGTPERADVATRAGAGGREAFVRYALPRAAYDAWLAEVAGAPFGSLTLGHAFPTEQADGWRVVASSDPEVPVGAAVAAVNGQPIRTIRDLPPAAGAALTLEGPQGRREVKLP